MILGILHPKTHLALGLAVLLLGVPLVATAEAESPPRPEPAAASAQPRVRNMPPEPTGRNASPAAMKAGRISCGEVITRSTTLTADVGPCPGNGIIIGADNIMLNLNGHTISGTPEPGDGNAAGIRLPNRKGVRVTGLPGSSGKKGTVTGFDAGVFINRGSGNTVENLAVVENVGPGPTEAIPEPLLGDGIILFYSANNRLMNNVVARNGAYDGIGVWGHGSNDNLIQGNTVEDTVGIDDRYNPSWAGHGIVITHFLNADDALGLAIFNNDVVDNVIRRNFTAGVSTIANHNGRIIGNTIEDNGDFDRYLSQRNGNGIGITTGDVVFFPSIGTTRMLVEGNKVNRNALTGIAVNRSASENRILRNEVRGNFLAGIFMGYAPNNLIAENTALDTVLFEDLFDFSFFRGDENCQGNIWRDNVYGTAAPECAAHGTQIE